jgi:hypothetical protein
LEGLLAASLVEEVFFSSGSCLADLLQQRLDIRPIRRGQSDEELFGLLELASSE